MSQWSGRGMSNYEKRLNVSRQEGVVGVYHHLRQPQDPVSRLGFKGRKPKKTTILEVSNRLSKEAETKPYLKAAADNLKRQADQLRPAPKTRRTNTSEQGYIQQFIAQLKAQPRAEVKPEPKSEVKQPIETPRQPKQPKTFDADELRKKAKLEHLKRMADDLKVRQYSEQWVNGIKLSNKPG